MRRALISVVLVAVAVVVQVTMVDRIAFPGGAGPNLVLIVVAALALASGPMAGVLIGFWAGLALDVAPPGSHLVGQNALVFCLVGYCCGLLADKPSGDGVPEPGHTALFEIVVVAAGAVVGEALLALLGVMLSDPRVTWPAVTRVLPAAVVYDVLLSSFVLYAVAASLRLAGARRESRPAAWSARPVPAATSGAGQAALREVTGGNAPRLRLADRGSGPAGARRGPTARPAAKREPRLKLGTPGPKNAVPASAVTGPRGGLGAAFAGGLGTSPARIRFSSSTTGRSLLGGSVFNRPRPARPVSFGRPSPLGRSSPFRPRGNLMLSPGGGRPGSAPRFSRRSPLTRLTSTLHRSAGPKSPGRGWLRGASSRRAPAPPALGRTTMRRGAFGRGRLGRGGRSWPDASAPRRQRGLRIRRAGLGMPRPRKPRTRRRWRTGGGYL